MAKKIGLGFSGGFETTYSTKYPKDDKGFEVHSVIVNTGGFSMEELDNIEAHAKKLGLVSHTTVNAVES